MEGTYPFEQQIIMSLCGELIYTAQKPVLALQVITCFELLPRLGC